MFTSTNNTVTRLIAAIVDLAKTFLGFFTSLSTYTDIVIRYTSDDGVMEYDLRKKVAHTHCMCRQ